jgi:hypothetical protein
MIRTIRGSYVRTKDDEGIGYVMFRTKTEAKEWVESQGKEDCFVVKVRAAITPIDSGRAERLVAVRKAQSKAVPKEPHHNFFP